ncbi:hypothetical protein P170DRAFT_157409 [Aspergillus steynii IBT 23096]|uniref:Uncharacterized protein n=1 Tax=Aspergillus steynii IBT 23096 TaxID=1392250 RepID=A0A2I2GDS4_9EURO|nr:uncharacterized protein P170DRAFT_157409 [Aspergillus steynii IBT 23096]PLB50967.1 hypothetical protein P170DRAFT_157409 [Aspergillus steynii IBT 23096]
MSIILLLCATVTVHCHIIVAFKLQNKQWFGNTARPSNRMVQKATRSCSSAAMDLCAWLGNCLPIQTALDHAPVGMLLVEGFCLYLHSQLWSSAEELGLVGQDSCYCCQQITCSMARERYSVESQTKERTSQILHHLGVSALREMPVTLASVLKDNFRP